MSREDERRTEEAIHAPGRVPERETPEQKTPEQKTPERRTYDATDARQGEIILRTRRRRIIFFGGLIGLVLVGLLLRVCAGTA